jgi:hypothetical protein
MLGWIESRQEHKPSGFHQTGMKEVKITNSKQRSWNSAYLNKISQDHIPMGFQYSERYEQDKALAVIVSPQNLPQSQDFFKRKLSFEGNQHPS